MSRKRLMVRIRDDLRGKIQLAATVNGRSLSEEMEARLEASVSLGGAVWAIDNAAEAIDAARQVLSTIDPPAEPPLYGETEEGSMPCQ